MINMVSEGKTIRFTAAADVLSGELVAVGDLFCVAVNPVTSGAFGVGAVEGVFSLPKDDASIDQGKIVYLDSNGNVTETDTGSLPVVGKAWEAALAGASHIAVKIG